MQSCISRSLRGSGEPRLQLRSGSRRGSLRCGTAHLLLSQAPCGTQSAAAPAALASQWPSGSPVERLGWVLAGGLCSCLQMEGGCEEGAVNPDLRSRSS